MNIAGLVRTILVLALLGLVVIYGTRWSARLAGRAGV